jgi:hypothetical protein
MLFLQYMTSIVIPETSEHVIIQRRRLSAISQKLVDKFEDDDYDMRMLNDEVDHDNCDDDDDDEESQHRHQSQTRKSSGLSNILSDESSVIDAPNLMPLQDLQNKPITDVTFVESGNQVNRYPSNFNNNGFLTNDSILSGSGSGSGKESKQTGLKRPESFYAPNSGAVRNIGWWNNLSHRLLRSRSSEKLSRRISIHEKKEIKRAKKQKGKKVYRRRVLNPTMDALNLSALPIFEYPQSDVIKAWNAPLTQDAVSDESEFDILDLEIW